MSPTPDFDLQTAHRYFSAHCFNRAWDLIEKPDRTPADDEEMIRLCLAAQWHWSQRDDSTPKSQSIGYWQASRIFALLDQADNARQYGLLCLEASQSPGVAPFYLGYAYEALARAEAVAGNRKEMDDYLDRARGVADSVKKAEDRKQLLDDLATIKI
jgi:hypothetical protein